MIVTIVNITIKYIVVDFLEKLNLGGQPLNKVCQFSLLKCQTNFSQRINFFETIF